MIEKSCVDDCGKAAKSDCDYDEDIGDDGPAVAGDSLDLDATPLSPPSSPLSALSHISLFVSSTMAKGLLLSLYPLRHCSDILGQFRATSVCSRSSRRARRASATARARTASRMATIS